MSIFNKLFGKSKAKYSDNNESLYQAINLRSNITYTHIGKAEYGLNSSITNENVVSAKNNFITMETE